MLLFMALMTLNDIKWKQDGNSWHNGMLTGFGLKSIVKIPFVNLQAVSVWINSLQIS